MRTLAPLEVLIHVNACGEWMKHFILLSILLLTLPVSHAQERGTVTGIAWNGSTWLIVGHWSNTSHLLEYDGKTFRELKDFKKFNITFVHQVFWNNDTNYWVITGHKGDDTILIKFDGMQFEQLASVHSYCTGDTVWDGKGYLMVVCGSAMVGETGYVKLLENGSIAEGVPFYWGYGRIFQSGGRIFTHNGTVLFLYNGTNFEKFSEIRILAEDMAFNGRQWVICGYDKLVEFNFTYHPHVISIGGCDEIEWGNGYWLIANDGQLFKYDGNRLMLVENMPEFGSINAVKWNGEYWLIGGRGYGGSPKLVNYDGSAFKDLTPQLVSLRQQQANTTQRKSDTIKEPQTKNKAVCGPSLILLLSVSGLLLRRYSPVSWCSTLLL